jgi:NAD(P)-dependent dehydrogenase (short-subunit alcohol dehydrogenase family)
MNDVEATRVAFVTGASSGIGRATAVAFAEAGYAVALADRNADDGRAVEEELRKAGHACSFFACDVADEDEVRNAVGAAVARFGRLDAAFNAAGIDGWRST